MPSSRDLLDVLHELDRRLDPSSGEGDVSLAALAERAGWSPFHLQREFSRVFGETPKQYALRVRLTRAAAALAAPDASVREVAATAGFGSAEAFARAFKQHFGCTPSRYRARMRTAASRSGRRAHQRVVAAATPCLNLFHFSVDSSPRRTVMPTSSIARKTIEAQPFLFVRRRVAPADIAKTVGEGFGAVMGYGHSVGAVFAGRPVTRYPEMSPGMMTLEIGFPLAAPVAGNGAVECGTLSGGMVVFAVHEGAYAELGQSYTAMEKWMQTHGVKATGAPWESYITDPAEHPNPVDWRTEIYWPVAV